MQFGSLERVYAFILSEAGKKNRSLNFNREFPAAVTVATDPHEVPGAFVKDGWNFVTKEALPHPDRYFSGEPWVLGTAEGQQIVDRNKLEQDLRKLYYDDFIKEWRTYLKSASLVPYTDVKDAAQKLGRITSSDSPLLAVFSLASQHTAVDDPAVANALQPVQAVVPPDSKGRLITPANQNYINALGMLQTSLESSTGQADDPAIAQTLNNAPQAKMAARQIGQTFRPDSDADMKATAQKLLEDPITNLEQMLRGSLPRELNGAGAGLCSSLRTVTGKYPFNPNSKAEVTLPELNSVFRKPDGMLWALYEKTFKKVLVKQGNQYVAQPGGTVTVNPAFVSFFNAAAGFSDALYPVGATEPTFTYTLTPVPNDIVQTITVRIDGQTLTYSLGSPVAPKPFTWKGSGTHDVTAGVRFGGPNEITWLQESGLWSLFRFFGMAEQRTPRSLEWIVRIGRGPATVNGRPVTVRLDVDLGAAAPFLRPASLACVAEVAR
jgi:type VI secretion system protein ImpL